MFFFKEPFDDNDLFYHGIFLEDMYGDGTHFGCVVILRNS